MVYRPNWTRNTAMLKGILFILTSFVIYGLLSNKSVENYRKFSECCDLLKSGDKEEIAKYSQENIPDNAGDLQMDDCHDFVRRRKYFDYPISEEERQNPLAYAIVVFKDSKQVEKLLRAIYRTSNIYCIHVDTKSTSLFHSSLVALTSCFDNVFLISTQNVQWGTISTLDAELDCMRVLHKNAAVEWKYLINLAGQEFPLKSNREIVRITKVLGGANWVDAHIKLPEWRYEQQTKPIPYGLTLYKGPVHVILSRGFVRFIFENATAQVLLQWLANTNVPDESFYQALNYNSQILRVPGSYSGNFDFLNSTRHDNRYKLWINEDVCLGFHVRNVCILSVGHLPSMIRSAALFANKFYYSYNPTGLDCLDRYIEDKSYGAIQEIDDHYLDYYRNLDFVKHHI